MKYLILLYYFLMVHLCNINTSAIAVKHKPQTGHYDIDGFISQLLASRKFDELADKLAGKAANWIAHIADGTPTAVQRASDVNEVKNRTGNAQQGNREHGKGQLNKIKLRKEFSAKIDPQAVLNETASLSKNLKLKYKYLKKNAMVNKMNINHNPVNLTKQQRNNNNLTKNAYFNAHNDVTEVRTSEPNAIEENQQEAKQNPIDENQSSQDDTQVINHEVNPITNSEINDDHQSGMDGETNDNIKNNNHKRQEQEQTNSRKEPKVEGTGEQEYGTSHVDTEIRQKENPSILFIEHQKNPDTNEDKITAVEKTELRLESDTKENIEDDNVVIHDGASDRSGDRSKERSTENQISKEKSDDESVSSEFKPTIREEGGIKYTYVQAPEYQEYHEEMAKLQKSHPQNPVDFIK